MPYRLWIVVLAVTAFAALPRHAVAQSTKKLGLSIGYPTSVALLWQPSARVGIRPELAFGFGHFETSSSSIFGPSRISSDSRQMDVGISVLFLVYREENLSLYVTPGYVHRRGKTSTESDEPPGVFSLNDDREISGHAIKGSLGARYTLGPRFGVFGEVGMDHERSKTTRSSEAGFDARVNGTGVRSAVGVVFFF